MFNSGSPSLADIAAVTDKNNNGNGWGDGNGWWVLIILFALFGWGGNGWGAGRGNNNCNDGGGTTVVTVPTPMGGYGYGYGYGIGGGFMDAAIQRGFDNQAVIQKLDGINNGICSLGYDQLNQMNGLGTQIMQGNFGLQQALNNLSVQLGDCCCENRAAIAQVRYDMATDTCALKTEVHQTGDAIIQNQNAGFNMLNQTIQNGFTNLAMAQKDQQIAELTAKLNACDRDAALANQSTYLLNVLNPTARPSYIVQNPNCCGAVPVTIQSQGCGCGQNFGCCA